jgi:pyruvate-formate lyase-activating enzyme
MANEEIASIDVLELPADSPASANGLPWTRRRTLTKRGVLWLGQTCNLRCFFCYFLNRIEDNSHIEHPFMDLAKAKQICHTMRYTYGNTAVDIQGGEPTIYPGILDLISYCREIGLHPTLITNALHLAKPGKLEPFKEAGIRDFLISFHGLGDVHDKVVQKKGAYEKMCTAIDRMRELDIPFRFNCTMTNPVVPLVPKVAQKAIDYGARAVNYIVFNCFEDDSSDNRDRSDEAEATYADLRPYLTEAIDMLEDNGVECNVRYMPICQVEPRHRKNVFNYQQLSYDHHEWDYGSWIWSGLQPQRMKPQEPDVAMRLGWSDRRTIARIEKIRKLRESGRGIVNGILAIQNTGARIEEMLRGKEALCREEGIKRARDDGHYQYGSKCTECAARDICDGFHGDYADHFGTDEARPITGIPRTQDPNYYTRNQEKFVEPEDQPWAL